MSYDLELLSESFSCIIFIDKFNKLAVKINDKNVLRNITLEVKKG